MCVNTQPEQNSYCAATDKFIIPCFLSGLRQLKDTPFQTACPPRLKCPSGCWHSEEQYPNDWHWNLNKKQTQEQQLYIHSFFGMFISCNRWTCFRSTHRFWFFRLPWQQSMKYSGEAPMCMYTASHPKEKKYCISAFGVFHNQKEREGYEGKTVSLQRCAHLCNNQLKL